MKKTLLLSFFLFSFSISLSAAVLRGVVKDAAGQPISGASVTTAEADATTDANGAFVMDVIHPSVVLRFAHPGFESKELTVKPGEAIEVTLATAFAETIVVSAIRADAATPVTKTDIPRAEIEQRYYGQDVPMLLRDAPSVTTYSESGAGGSGYSYVSLRGVSPTRINFTLDGVPLADSEDMGTYFADFPDLARSLESIQIQRGVGTSTVGTPSFGGSVNMASIDLGQNEATEATFGAGSFGGKQASVGYHSGTLPSGFAFYTRVSFLENEGFRENSATRQRNVFFSGSKQVGDALLKITGFSGHERMQSSYYAVDEATLQTNLRFNPMRPEERDSFGYDLAQVQYIRPLGADSDMTASVYYQRGYGWFRLFSADNDLQRYGLDGMLLGAIGTYSKTRGPLTLNTGVHVNRFQRDHTRDNLASETRDYANYGVKGEANAFAKLTYNTGSWLLYGDAQVRHASFDYHGDVDIAPIGWTFFNPKVGARYALSPTASLYASAGMTTREPTRNDMFLGEDNAPVTLDLHATKPERVVDVEAGWQWRTPRVEFSANVYDMEFHNEIAATGEQSEIGLSLRKNVDRSYRRGIELESAWQVTKAIALRTNANLSRNRIRSWTQFIDVYDIEGNWVDSRPANYRDVEPLLTPSVVLNQSVEYTPSTRFSAGVIGRYVSRSFLDNTNNRDTDAPAYFIADANASFAVTNRARLSLQVNNLLDNDRIRPSGYSYLYYSGTVLNGTSYYYPHATRNFTVLLDVKR
ncbi:MAG TPA: TonB-dependent receptor [Thermoanaerobaculia bacterium]|nr:TonB-dependent receptor [Thermoanaerobaculia bacterium]